MVNVTMGAVTIVLCSLLAILHLANADYLALLSATLRTYRRTGCDTEQLSLNCPRGTSISIEVAQYSKNVGDGANELFCPPSSEESLLAGEAAHSGTEIEIKTPESCMWPNALQTVVETCQKKQHCKFFASPRSYGGDPCPGVRRFIDVSYKCRPYEFRSKVACENDVIQLICNPYSRIAVYSASYGRTEYESIQCSQPQGVKEETCLLSYATETVMQLCHGRRRCSLSADSSTFGKPCRPDSRMYLKVVYTCVPRKVLKDRYDSPPEPDEPFQTDLDQDQDELYDEDQFYRESEAIPPAPKLLGDLSKGQQRPSETPSAEPSSSAGPPLRSRDSNGLEARLKNTKYSKRYPSFNSNSIRSGENQSFYKTTTTMARATTTTTTAAAAAAANPSMVDGQGHDQEIDKQVFAILADWINAYVFVAKNQERLYLYLIIAVSVGVLLCVILVIGRFVLHRRRNTTDKKFQTSTTGETTLPNGFSDDISEIDADIDLTTAVPVSSVSRNEPAYGSYAPSPSPYGNLGPSNVSHTSTTMLVPSANMMGGGGGGGPPPTIINASNALMRPPLGSPMGNLTPIGTISQHHPGIGGGIPAFLGGSIMGHGIGGGGGGGGGGTLRRTMPHEYDTNVPRSLSRGTADNAQYYYG